MKNLFKKFSTLFLVALLFTAMVGSQKVSARPIYNPSWTFEITQVTNTRVYGSGTYGIGDMVQRASSGNTYNVNTNYIGVQCKFTNIVPTTYLWVDGSFTGKNDVLNFQQSGNSYYKTILVGNLTPGTHRIEIKASAPTGTDVKSEFIYVTIPTK